MKTGLKELFLKPLVAQVPATFAFFFFLLILVIYISEISVIEELTNV